MGILVGERTYLATAQEIEYRLSEPVVAKGKAGARPRDASERPRCRPGDDRS
jgi:hypothetical protein